MLAVTAPKPAERSRFMSPRAPLGALRGRPAKATGAAVILLTALLASCGSTGASALRGVAPQHSLAAPGHAPPGNLRPPTGTGLSSWWERLLAQSKNLGPSRVATATVIIDLAPGAGGGPARRWAESHQLGLTWYVGRSVAVLAAKPAVLGAALGVNIDDFLSPGGQRFYAAAQQPRVPGALAGDVSAVGRVTDYKDYGDAYVGRGGLSPSALLEAYDAAPLRAQGLNGRGETIVAFEVDGYDLDNLNKFATKYGLPSFSRPDGFIVNGGEAGKPQGESDMDLETVREIAPAAKVVYYNVLQSSSGANFADLLLTAFETAGREYPGAIWTMSIGQCEKTLGFADLEAENKAVAAAEAKGTSVFAASGDSAGLECVDQPNWGASPTQNDVGVWQPAVLPAVTGVGGTTLSVTTTGQYYSETAWYYPALGQGTSGGTSTTIAQPSWQVGKGLPTPTDSTPRQVPDVSAVADPLTGNSIYESGWTTGGGTSLATPIWAAFVALIDEYLRREGKPPVGFINPDLYYLADHNQPYPPFHPITTGGNSVWRNGAGYNQSTGLGSPDVYNLARDLSAHERA